MDISAVKLLLSAPQAASGYTSPGSVYNSNGKWASTTQLNASVPMNNLFPDLSGAQNAAQMTDYQCVFVYNSDPSSTLANVRAWIPATSVTGTVAWAVGADTTGATSYNSILPQAGQVTAPTLAPSTVTTFVGPSSDASGGASLPTIGPGQVAALWVRRTAVNSPAFQGAGFNLQVTFDVVG